MTSFRLGKLYEDAKKANKTKEMPTLVGILFRGLVFTPYEESYDFIMKFVEEFKPVRILFVYLWPNFRIYHGWGTLENRKKISDEYFYENIGYFIKYVKNCTDRGIEVTTNNFLPYDNAFNPKNMIDINGVI